MLCADAFGVQRFPVTRSDEEMERMRSNPDISLTDVRAIRRYDSPEIAAVMAQAANPNAPGMPPPWPHTREAKRRSLVPNAPINFWPSLRSEP